MQLLSPLRSFSTALFTRSISWASTVCSTLTPWMFLTHW